MAIRCSGRHLVHEGDAGVVVLVDARTDDSPWALAQHLLFSGSPLPPLRGAPVRPRFVTLSRAALEACTGSYRLEAGGLLHIAPKGDYLLVDTRGNGVSSFFPTSERDFVSNTEEEALTFEVAADGGPSGLVLRGGGTSVRARRIAGL